MSKPLIGLFLILILGWFISPQPLKGKVYSLIDNNIERQCFDYYKSSLDDPETAYLVERDIPAQTRNYSIQVKAKNEFGAYQSISFDCKSLNGELDRAATLRSEVANILLH